MIFTKNKKEFERFGLLKKKNVWLENILAHEHLWRGSTQIEYWSQKTGTTSMKIANFLTFSAKSLQ